jgi:SH3-like domain-containing protein
VTGHSRFSLSQVKVRFRTVALFVSLCAIGVGAGCGPGKLINKEYVYVTAPQVTMRDRLSAVYTKVGTLKNGDRVEVLEKSKRFYRVRAEGVGEGWIEERYVVDQQIFDGFTQLARQYGNAPAQAHGIARNELNIHLTPDRDSEHLYRLAENEKVDILQRAVTDKNAKAIQDYQQQLQKYQQRQAAAQAQLESTSEKQGVGKTPDSQVPKPSGSAAKSAVGKPATEAKAANSNTAMVPQVPSSILEDWWLVRDSQKHVGWVLARMVDIDVPLEIAQYAEGQRIVASFVINTVQDVAEDGTTKQVPQYLVLTTEPKDGQPFDYNHIRVFSWNGKRHRYETAYRERNLFGVFPVSVGHEVFDKEGDLPTFTIHVKDDKGQTVEKKYKMNGPIVRRVLSPGEEAAQKQALAQKIEEMKAARAARIAQYKASHPSAKPRHKKH